MTKTTTTDPERHAEIVRVIADRSLVLALLVAGVVLAMLDDREHAGLLLAGALGALSPLGARAAASAPARALPLVLGLGGALALSGCAGSVTAAGVGATLRTAARVSCEVVSRAHDACEIAGLAPRREDSCPGIEGER
jgi:hypothetical protein